MHSRVSHKGKQQSETVLTTLKPTAVDKTEYKPGIHEDIYLRLCVRNKQSGAAHGGNPTVHFSYSLNGKTFTDCGSSFNLKQGKWIGAKFGFISAETNAKADRGWVDADWIRVTSN